MHCKKVLWKSIIIEYCKAFYIVKVLQQIVRVCAYVQSNEQTCICMSKYRHRTFACICMCSAHIFIDIYTSTPRTHTQTRMDSLHYLWAFLSLPVKQSDWHHRYPESFQCCLSLRYKSYDLWRQHLEVHGLWQDLGNRPWRLDSTGIFRNVEGECQDLVWKWLTQPCSLECRCGRCKGVGVHALLSERSKRGIHNDLQSCNFAPFLIWFPAADFAVLSWI